MFSRKEGVVSLLFSFLERLSLRSSQESKRTPIVVGKLLWHPFHVRFENFEHRLQLHDEFLRDEISMIHLRKTVAVSEIQAEEQRSAKMFQAQSKTFIDLCEKMERRMTALESGISAQPIVAPWKLSEFLKENLIKTIRSWLNPPKSEDEFESALSLREKGTAEWISNQDTFTEWMASTDDEQVTSECCPTLWLNG